MDPYDRFGKHMPVPTAGRYADQARNTAAAAMRPIGGFNTTDAAMAAINSKLDSVGRLAALERSLIETRMSGASAEQKLQSMMAGDRLQLATDSLGLQRREFEFKKDQATPGLIGGLSMGAQAVTGLYNIARQAQGDAKSGFAKSVADFLGKFAPSAEKAYQARLSAEEAEKKLTQTISASGNQADNLADLYQAFNDRINDVGLVLGSLIQRHPEDFQFYSEIIPSIQEMIADVFGQPNAQATPLPSAPGTTRGKF